MKIVIDARIINSPTGRYCERLLHFLEEKDHSNDYLVLVRPQDWDFYKPRNPRFKLVKASFADYSFGEQLGLARLLYKLKPDLVHFCMPQQPLLYVKRSITTVHDLNLLRITSNDMGWLELQIKKLIFAVLLLIISWRSKAILSPSKFTKDDLVRFTRIPEKKVHVVYNGGVTPIKNVEPMPQFKDIDFIMHLGRAEPYKNNRALIEAHQQLLPKFPDLRLLIVGKIDQLRQTDMDWVQANDFKNVIFTGFVSNENQAWLYSRCKAYIAPSLMEGFGMPALEAMVNGAAVVSSNTTASPEVLGDAAYYFDPYKTEDMARAIGDVLSDPNLVTDLKQKGARQAQKYSWEVCAEQTLSVYRRVLAQK